MNTSHTFADISSELTSDATVTKQSATVSMATESQAFPTWEIPQNIISYETMMFIISICDWFLYPPVCLVGAITNLINCLVFYYQGLKDRMTLCLFILSLVDCLFLLSVFCLVIASFVKLADEEAGAEYGAKSMVYFGGIELGLKATSSCISSVIALERCVCVVNPLKAASLIRTRTMATLLAALLVTFQLMLVFFPFKYAIRDQWDDELNITSWEIVPSENFIQNEEAFHIIDDVLLSSVVPVTTFILVSMSTAVTVVKLKAAVSWRESSGHAAGSSGGQGNRHGNQKQSEAALTRMLVLLSCAYIAFSSPLIAVALTRFLVTDFSAAGHYHNLYWATHYLATLSGCVNSAVNFFVFVCQSTRFRHELRALFGSRCRVHKKPDKEKSSVFTSMTEN